MNHTSSSTSSAESSSESACSCHTASRLSQNERIQKAIDILKHGRLSLLTALIKVLDPSEESFSAYRAQLYASTKDQPTGKLAKLLDRIWDDPRGRSQLVSWMDLHAMSQITRKVSNEMDAIKDALRGRISSITPDTLIEWDMASTITETVAKHAPVLTEILHAAAQTKRANRENTTKDYSTACQAIITQLAKLRSNSSLFFAAPFTLFLWTNGTSRQVIEALARCGLCLSFTALSTMLNQLASQCIDKAIDIACRPHVLCYDNINISTSIFVEQRSSAPAKVQSGTFPILYAIENVTWDEIRLAPMLESARKATHLKFNSDIRPTTQQTDSMDHQARINVIDILLDGCTSFKDYEFRSVPLLKHEERRGLPKGHKTKQYPLRTSTIDESSISGNIAVINDVYLNQLKMSQEQLSDYAIPSINDQSTNARIRGAKALRTADVNPFTQLQFLQLGFGLFHLCMNLIWAILHVHRGSIDQPGSLSYFFAILNRSRLGCEHPDYHTLLSTLMQILQGIVLDAWKVECGHSSLAAFAASNPTPEELHDIADRIIKNHATPLPRQSADQSEQGSSTSNVANRNIQILTRDLLYVLELTRATSDGDFGRIEDMLSHLAMIFRGAGSNNYCMEILHFTFNLKRVWTPKFADIMRDNMLVNFTGLEGHFMPIDLNIEHLIRSLKRFFAAKGVYASWDRLGDISATVDLLQRVRKQVGSTLGTAYHGITHITPDTFASVCQISDKVHELGLHLDAPIRESCAIIKPVVDSLALGEQKLKSSTLATFNKKVQCMLAGGGFEMEVDELPQASFDLSLEPGDNAE